MSNFMSPDFMMKILKEDDVNQIYQEALNILENRGLVYESEEARNILLKNGCKAGSNNEIKIPRKLVAQCLSTAPSSFTLHNIHGEPTVHIGGNETVFQPGGCAVSWLEEDGRTIRPSESKDQVTLAKLVQQLPNIKMQSETVTLADVPDHIFDTYNAFLGFKHCEKPMVGGQSALGNMEYIIRLLTAIAGGKKEMMDKPSLVMDCCSLTPLKWCELACDTLMKSATHGVPLEFISVPMPGAVAPATLAGSLLLHCTEILSGIVLAQLCRPGAPVVYGSAPMYFDMTSMNPLLAAMESAMLVMGVAQMGKFFNLPTHAYAGLADSKMLDLQAGWEDAYSGLLAMLSGINNVSGIGQLEFVLVSSAEKLVAENELIGMLYRLRKGITVNEETMAARLIEEIGPGGDYLKTKHTMRWFRKEAYFPNKIVDRQTRKVDSKGDEPTLQERSRLEKERLLAINPGRLEFKNQSDFDKEMKAILKENNLSSLPFSD